jgi:YD repeat-containing protein
MEGKEKGKSRSKSTSVSTIVLVAFAVMLFTFTASLCIVSAGTVTYIYDDAGRLIKADYGNGAAIGYEYDDAGNLLERGITGEEPALFFDTSPGAYPSISGMHNGTITPNVTIEVSQLYTYPMCRNWRAFRICCLLSL